MSAISTPVSAPSSQSIGKLSPVAHISSVAWVPSREMELPEWVAAGRRLGVMGRCGQWGIGDWIRYGNAKFGERYARAARITGYDVQTLTNMVYVASRFEISRRRENLSWSHHETLASLDIDGQEHWLDDAISRRLSVSDLRLVLRSSRRGLRRMFDGGRESSAAPVDDVALICPKCGTRVPLSSSHAGQR